jgi:hypothetical protein
MIVNSWAWHNWKTFSTKVMLHFYFIIGDSLKYHNRHKFSTKDNENDSYAKNCATMFKGGWWYNVCLSANLNGLYLNGTYYVHGTGMGLAVYVLVGKVNNDILFTLLRAVRN